MTPQEIQYVTPLRDRDLRKFDAKKLQDIYNKYTGSKAFKCMCSAIERKIFQNAFFTWFDQNYPTPNDSEPTE